MPVPGLKRQAIGSFNRESKRIFESFQQTFTSQLVLWSCRAEPRDLMAV